jgi:prolyl 4-hydroxylase
MNSEQEIVPSFSFTIDSSFDSNNVVKQDILPDNHCFVLYNLFTQSECQELISVGEQYGFLDLTNKFSQSYRNNQRIVNYNTKLQKVLYDRILPYMDHEIEVQNKHPTITTTFYTSGIWHISGLNDTFRLCKYNPSNYFKRHCDEGFHPNPVSHRSLKTCMLYLNSDFEGGDTAFYLNDLKNIFNLNDSDLIFSLKPQIGMCLIFNQNILHEGTTVTSGLKYFIRTDILYKKTKSYVDESLTEVQIKALELYENGLEFERNCENDLAIKMYAKAHKLYDRIEELYNSLY